MRHLNKNAGVSEQCGKGGFRAMPQATEPPQIGNFNSTN